MVLFFYGNNAIIQSENKNKKMKINYKKNKTLILIPTFVILIGIFLSPQTAFFANIKATRIIELTNIERQKNGATSLKINQLLTQAAEKKAKAIFKQQVFKHNLGNKKFSKWVQEENYKYAYVGENLAIDFSTNRGVIKAWLASPSHRKNLLNKNFSEIGVAVVEGKFKGEISTVVVQIFATPLNAISITKDENYASPLLDAELKTNEDSYIYSEPENSLYALLSDQKLIYKKFNPRNNKNIEITFYVTGFYSIVLIFIYLLQALQIKFKQTK